MGDLGAESSVVHQEHVQIAHISHNKLSQSIGKVESSFLIVTITDLGHGFVASESSSHSVVDTWAYGR